MQAVVPLLRTFIGLYMVLLSDWHFAFSAPFLCTSPSSLAKHAWAHVLNDGPSCFRTSSPGTLASRQLMTTLIPPFAAVVMALNISLGADVGGFFLETIAKELNAELLSRATPPAASLGGGGDRGRGRGACSNLLLLLAYLYNFGLAHCTLVYDIVRLLVDGTFSFCSIFLPVFLV